jgi:NodT family efflux transporter outer membrane factor (OMF) lipoprotein
MKTITVLITGFLVLLSGCSVGPEYSQPDIPEPNYSDTLGVDSQASGQGEISADSLEQWWTRLDDPVLTDLIHKALANNKDIQKARAVVKQARAQLGIAESSLFFHLNSRGSYTRSQGSENSFSTLGNSPVDLYQLGLDAEWEIDIFGGNRKAVAAARADLMRWEENLRDVWVSLAAEVALNYLDLRTYQQRLRIARDNLEAQKETLELIKSRRKAGLSDELALQQARYNLETTRSTIPVLTDGLEKTKSNLAVLTGRQATEINDSLDKVKPLPLPEIKTITGIPANSLRRRPDIRSAESRLAAQTARIGEAVSELYPKFNLTGSIGLESIKSSTLFMSESDTYSFGPSFSWPLFQAGAIRENIKAQTAIKEQYIAQYEKTVLEAVKEVKDALIAYAKQQQNYQSLADAVDAARSAVQISRDKYKNGLTDFNNVLDAQRSLFNLQDELALSRGQVTGNLIRLYKALGGGWETMDPNSSQITIVKTENKSG